MSPSSNPTYSIVKTDESTFITVVVPGLALRSTGDDHPSFDKIVKLVTRGDKALRKGKLDKAQALFAEAHGLFDVAETVARKFEKLTDRIAVRNGRVYLDGDEMSDALTDHLLKTMDEGGDFLPLARFYERLATNPLGHAREALYPWMQGNKGFTITDEGMLIGYKSVVSNVDADTGEVYYTPTRNDGGGIVNGVEFKAGEWLVQRPGDVVEMPRSIVLHEPSSACGEGLHVGTSGYAFGFSGDTVVEVHFDPRDVVNVPNTQNKIRVCRYTVVGPVSEARTTAVIGNAPEDERDEDYCGDCYESQDDCICIAEDEYPDDGCGDPDCDYCYGGDVDEDEGWLNNEKPTLTDLEGETTADVETAIEAAQDALDDARDALGRFTAGNPGRGGERGPDGRFVG